MTAAHEDVRPTSERASAIGLCAMNRGPMPYLIRAAIAPRLFVVSAVNRRFVSTKPMKDESDYF